MPELLISADSHVMEPLDLWTRHLPARLRDRGPRIEARDGRACLLVEERVVRKFGVVDSGQKRAEYSAEDEVTSGLASSGARDPDARLRDLDRDGVWGEVMYPNLAFFCTHRIEDAEVEQATCRVYNDWVAEHFLQASPRFCPVAILPVRDVEGSIAELRRAAQRGFRAVLLPTHVDFRPYNAPAYDPLWSEAEALGVPLTFHAGTGRSQTPAHGPGGAVINYVVTVGCGPMETLAYLCGSGILARHPALRVALVECGSGWLAWALQAMDEAYREHHAWVRPKLDLLPSEYFRRQGAVTFQNDPVGFHNLRFTGERSLMWGSDYPHPEGTWPESRKALAEQLADVPAHVAERITCSNAAELYAFDLAAASLNT